MYLFLVTKTIELVNALSDAFILSLEFHIKKTVKLKYVPMSSLHWHNIFLRVNSSFQQLDKANAIHFIYKFGFFYALILIVISSTLIRKRQQFAAAIHIISLKIPFCNFSLKSHNELLNHSSNASKNHTCTYVIPTLDKY